MGSTPNFSLPEKHLTYLNIGSDLGLNPQSPGKVDGVRPVANKRWFLAFQDDDSPKGTYH